MQPKHVYIKDSVAYNAIMSVGGRIELAQAAALLFPSRLIPDSPDNNFGSPAAQQKQSTSHKLYKIIRRPKWMPISALML